ncbi:HK97 family phage prohead protease [uncultured Treponema sp.]|uniref:HK97 family phage prohead protease n=1 Tax=uncultured Treponema sp. TaxID=162155 RepID=UPI0025FD0168|nr:HK97 family phage prohead protease [uncultured Treponema sp.]
MDEELEKISKKLLQGRQYRSMKLECREMGTPDSEERIVEGYAATFNEPYILWEEDSYIFKEQIDSRAFDKCDLSDVIFQYNHVGRVYARISNKTLEVRPDGHGLFIKANLGGTGEGRSLFEEIKGGYTTKMSFGFVVRGERMESIKDEATGKRIYIRTITDFEKVYDVSAVSSPANDGTEISARSWCEGVIAGLEAERLKAEETEKRRKLESDERERELALLEFESN